MRNIILIIIATIVLAGCGKDSLDEARRWDSYYQDLEFRARYQSVIDATRLAWMVSPIILLAGMLWIGMDMYRRRAEPLVRLDEPVIERSQLREQFEQIMALQRDLAELRAQVAIVAAAHQPPHTYAPKVVITGASNESEPSSVDQNLPTAPPLRDLISSGFRPTIHRVILGYSRSGPVYAPLSGLLSTAVAGRPGQGKSTLLRLVAYQTLAAGGVVYLLDPHGSIADDVAAAPVAANAAAPRDLDDVAAHLTGELERRLSRYRSGRRDFVPQLALVDELPAVALVSKRAMQAVSRIILEGRKVGMYCFVSGQGLPAESFGGRLVRDALSSRYVFKTSVDEARRSGLPRDAARLVQDLRPGVAVVDAGVLASPDVLAIPNCGAAELELLKRAEAAGSGRDTPAKSPPAASEAAGSGRDTPAESPPAANDRVEKVREMLRKQASQNDILREVWGVTSGARYQEAARELRAIIAALVS